MKGRLKAQLVMGEGGTNMVADERKSKETSGGEGTEARAQWLMKEGGSRHSGWWRKRGKVQFIVRRKGGLQVR